MKLKDEINFDELLKLGFKKDKFLGYVFKEKYNDNWDRIICNVNEETREICFSQSEEEKTKKILEGLYEIRD